METKKHAAQSLWANQVWIFSHQQMKLFECANVTESHVVHDKVLQSDSSTMWDKIVEFHIYM